MSIHLKEGVVSKSKSGKPGSWKLINGKTIISNEHIQDLASEIIDASSKDGEGFIEIKRDSSSIIQLGDYRIVITFPPLSDGWEITAVKPVTKLNLTDYNLNSELEDRIKSQGEGILISGAPGEGKSTFVQALAEFFLSQNKIIKTIETPRDLNLSKDITQYSLSKADKNEIRDLLLLSRPDYTFFDEMRTTNDFKLFSDLRLSGVGMVGVVHATNPVDAIQRFIGRIELGVIPHVIDTVIFIKSGKIEKIYDVKMEIKVPNGMSEKDLARPLIVVKDFVSKTDEFEIYSFGDDTVVMPIKKEDNKKGINKIVENKIEEYFEKFNLDIKAKLIGDNKVKIYVPKKDISKIVGKDRENINKIEQITGLDIQVEGIAEEKKSVEKIKVNFKIEFTEKFIHVNVGETHIDKTLDIYCKENYLVSTKVGKKGIIKIRNESDVGQEVIDGIKKGDIMIFFCP